MEAPDRHIPGQLQRIFFSGQGDKSEIFELDLSDLELTQLTELGEYVSTPESSPDNRHILFTYRAGNNNRQIWIMDRDGTNPRPLYRYSGRDAHDATWSPDGSQILFAFGRGENNQLYIMDRSGHDPELVNESIDTRGHSSWSVHDRIVLDMGGSFMHEIYIMNVDGTTCTRPPSRDSIPRARASPRMGNGSSTAAIRMWPTRTPEAVRSTSCARRAVMYAALPTTISAITSRAGENKAYTNRRGKSGKL
jgi:Tol biopolymer transport system component